MAISIEKVEVAEELVREREAEQAKAHLAALLDDSADAVISKTLDGIITSWNKGAEALYGYTAEEAVGQPISMLVPREHSDEIPRILERISRGEKVDHLESVRVTADGRRLTISLAISPIRGYEGNVIGASTIARDITERKQAGEALREARDELERRVEEWTSNLEEVNADLKWQITKRKRAEEELNQLNEQLEKRNLELNHKNREIEAFVYSVSHDLRSPLVNLEGFSQELGLVGKDMREIFENSDLPPEARRRGLELIDEDMKTSIHFIRTGVKRLSDIIDALLRLSRAGRVEYRWQWVDLNPVIGRVLDAMRDTIAEGEAEVTVGDLPPAWGDPTQLEQVFANLISNALNYLDSDRPGLVEVGCKGTEELSDAGTDSRSLIYYVRDNGVGISEQALDKVFQVFKRLHPEKAAGEGLGLTVVQRIVERHGGRIWVESIEGEGSTFFVRLPNDRGGRPS